jgi:hypothetical protein
VLRLKADFKLNATLWGFAEAIVQILVGRVEPTLLNEKSNICKELVLPNALVICSHPGGRNLFQCKNSTFRVELCDINLAIAGALTSVKLFLLKFRYFKDVSFMRILHNLIVGSSPILLPSRTNCCNDVFGLVRKEPI